MSASSPKPDLIAFTEQGSGPALLLVHGAMITGEMFEPVIKDFAARHRVIVPDLRGHGRSRKLPPPYTSAQLASDIAHLLDHLGIGTAAVLGYSQGGAIAQQLVLDYPNRCHRLVLACTYAFNMATFRERLEGRIVPLLIKLLGMRRFAKLIIAQGLKRLPKERANWVVGLIADQSAELMKEAWKTAIAFDSRHRLAGIKCPALIVAASNDNAVPLHHAKKLQEGIPGSRLVIIDDADHALIWTHPAELVRVTQEFLDAESDPEFKHRL
jgi:3-oxoadipate enol-lactonase